MHPFSTGIQRNKHYPLTTRLLSDHRAAAAAARRAVCLPVLILFLTALMAPAVAQNQQPPCSAPSYRQFDFWVGEWEVVKPGTDTVVGHNHIKNILNGCVIEENWTGGGGFQGKSFNTYNPVDSTWNQVWVDMGGSTYHFKGRYADHVMLMRGETVSPRKKEKLLFEMSYTHDPEAGTVRQVWKTSADEGKSWNVMFDGVYRKK